jgi:hypothetical protein
VPYWGALGPGRSIRRWTHSQGWGLPGGCQTVTSRTKLSLLCSMLSLQLAQPPHMDGEKRHTEKVMKCFLLTRCKEMASPSLIRLTLELYTRISFLENFLKLENGKPISNTTSDQWTHTIFFAPYLLRHLTTDKRNLVTDYNVSVGAARGSKNIGPTTTRILTWNWYGRFNFRSSRFHSIFSVKEFTGFLGKKIQKHISLY